MAFCPRCGAATTTGMSFCTACGENLPATPAGPATAASVPPGTVAPPAPSGPVGKRVRPWIVVALSIVFSGIYPLWFWWRTSREMDAYAGSRSHPIVRTGVALAAAAIALAIVIGGIVAQEIGVTAIIENEGLPVAAQRFADAVAAHPWTTSQVALSVLGAGVLYTGLWRLWTAMRDEDQRRQRSPSFDPRLALAILATGTALPLLSYVVTDESTRAVVDLLTLVFGIGSLVVVYQVQARLNETWQAASHAPLAPAGARW